MVYPALLPLMCTPRLPVVDRTDAPVDLNGLVRFAERRNLVSARVPSHFKRSLPHCDVSDTFATLGLLIPEDEGTAIVRNVSNCLPLCTLSHP
jgi:hypothetical protein